MPSAAAVSIADSGNVGNAAGTILRTVQRRGLQRDSFGKAWLSAGLGGHASAALQGHCDVSRLGAEREQRAQKQVH